MTMGEPFTYDQTGERDGVAGTGLPDLVTKFDTLSYDSKSSIQVLLHNLAKGEAILKEDKDGKQFIEYQERKVSYKNKRKPHPSQANVIVKPRSDVDVQNKVEACLELIDHIKQGKAPSGVFLDPSKIRVKDGQYAEGKKEFGFTRTKEILGRGLYGGDIIVVKDNKTQQEHALKTIMISVFRKEEIQCWVDLSETGYVPSLYLFKMKENKVEVHMEVLREAMTIQSIIENHLSKLDQSLLKPFSLYVLDGTLEVVSKMHGKNWVHNDLHEGNMMVQKSKDKVLQLKIIDFGRASKYRDQDTGLDSKGFRSDLRNVIGMYCSVYGAQKVSDFNQADWYSEIENQLPEMSQTDKLDVLYLVKLAMDVVQPDGIGEFHEHVKQKLNNALDEIHKSEKDVLREVVGILFPEEKQDEGRYDDTDGIENAAKKSRAYAKKRSNSTVVVDELISSLEQAMCIGPAPNK